MAVMFQLTLLVLAVLNEAFCHHVVPDNGTNGFKCFCERDECGKNIDEDINTSAVRQCTEQLCRTTTVTKKNGEEELYRGCVSGSHRVSGCKNITVSDSDSFINKSMYSMSHNNTTTTAPPGFRHAVTCNCNLTDLCNFVKSGVTRSLPPPIPTNTAMSLFQFHVMPLIFIISIFVILSYVSRSEGH